MIHSGALTISAPDTVLTNTYVHGTLTIAAMGARILACKVDAPAGQPAIQILSGVNGVWIGQVHINANQAVGIAIPASDSVWVSDTLIEGPTVGVRIGSSGVCANVWLQGLVVDRASSVGVQVEPAPGGRVNNVQLSCGWSAGGVAGLFLNAADGPVETVLVTNWRVSNSGQSVWVNGPVRGVTSVGAVLV